MKNRMQKMLKSEKGLTLVELLAVIVILGIIAAIAVPSIGNIIENTKYNAVKADAISALNAANLYFVEDTTEASVTLKELVDEGYLENLGKLKDDMVVTKETKSISGTSEKYSGEKTVIFTDTTATLDEINADKQKGSTDSSKTIPKAG